MNNKQLGTAFEKKLCDVLAKEGFWVHFFTPDKRGAQPCDIIACKNFRAVLIDCKTLAGEYLTLDRLEDNQIMSFKRWIQCFKGIPYIFVEHNNEIRCIDYAKLFINRKVAFSEMKTLEDWLQEWN